MVIQEGNTALDKRVALFQKMAVIVFEKLSDIDYKPVQRVTYGKLSFSGTQIHTTFEPEYTEYYGENLRRYESFILSLEETQRYLEQCEHDNILSLSESARNNQLINEVIFYPLSQIMNICLGLRPTNQQVREIYRNFDVGAYKPNVEYTLVMPLINCITEIPITVDNITLSAFTDEEKTSFVSRFGFPFILPEGSLYLVQKSECKLTTTIFKNREIPYLGIHTINTGQNAKMHSKFKKLVTALRLLKSGSIGGSHIFDRAENYTTWSRTSAQMAVDHSSGKYLINAEDQLALQNILGSLNDHVEHELNVALRRFNLSYTRELPEDRIIDLTTCLERCLLAGEKEGIKYKFWLRGAALMLNDDGYNPETTRQMLEAGYDLRSDIVHNGSTINDAWSHLKTNTKNNLSIDTFPDDYANITRSILRKFIHLLHPSGSLKLISAKELDQRLLNGLK